MTKRKTSRRFSLPEVSTTHIYVSLDMGKTRRLKHFFRWWSGNRRKSKTQEYLDWFAFQQWLLETGAEIPPPWMAYPNQAPWSGGWRQGNGEAWLHEVWLPFWRTLDPAGRRAYVEKWNAPSEWREYLISPGHWS